MIKLLLGDCRDSMRSMQENSIDAIVSDPPYGLSFMGKGWDHGVPGVEFWAEALRIAKPGAYLLAFGGTRTFHRLTVAIEDAEWEIRDCIMWVYSSGFPKSHDVSKAIDKAAGAEREVVGRVRSGISSRSRSGDMVGGIAIEEEKQVDVTVPTTEAAKRWEGWGTALKPAWEPIIVARKPLIGTMVENVDRFGVGSMNIDGARIRNADQERDFLAASRLSDLYSDFDNLRAPLSFCLDVLERIVSVLRSCSTDDKGRQHSAHARDDTWPAGVGCAGMLLDHLLPSVELYALNWSSEPDFQGGCPACHRLCDELLHRVKGGAQAPVPSLLGVLSDTCQVLREWSRSHLNPHTDHLSNSDAALLVSTWLKLLLRGVQDKHSASLSSRQAGRWPANLIHDGSSEVVGLFPDVDGTFGMKKVEGGHRFIMGDTTTVQKFDRGFMDSGSAARFFYCAKASQRDRNDGCELLPPKHESDRVLEDGVGGDNPRNRTNNARQNHHPCVKPTDLMRYLCRLVTPPGGIVLDPFMGSGSTGKGAVSEGFSFVGCELDPDYVEIARARIAHVGGAEEDMPVKQEAKQEGPVQLGLFGSAQ